MTALNTLDQACVHFYYEHAKLLWEDQGVSALAL